MATRTDERPPGGGEYFAPRGIGTDVTPGCFVCGGPEGAYHNVSAFVVTKESGERTVAMFQHGAWLDFRPHEPGWIQVKVGACPRHLPNLKKLAELTYAAEGVITAEMIKEATEVEQPGSS